MNLCGVLRANKDFEIASQLKRAGTSVEANARESQRGSSTKDDNLESLYKKTDEVIKWLVTIIQSTGNS